MDLLLHLHLVLDFLDLYSFTLNKMSTEQ
jgi:hypothetical protein